MSAFRELSVKFCSARGCQSNILPIRCNSDILPTPYKKQMFAILSSSSLSHDFRSNLYVATTFSASLKTNGTQHDRQSRALSPRCKDTRQKKSASRVVHLEHLATSDVFRYNAARHIVGGWTQLDFQDTIRSFRHIDHLVISQYDTEQQAPSVRVCTG